MRMCVVQEARRESVSVSYVWKMQDSILGPFVFLEPWCVIYYLAVVMLEQNLEKRIESTNEAGHEEFSDSQSVWSHD